MAFGGTPVVTSLGKRIVRITGATLAASTAGTIKAYGGGGDISLPATFPTLDATETLVVINQIAAGAVSPWLIAKDSPFTTVTVTNTDAGHATGELEIFVIALHSIMK